MVVLWITVQSSSYGRRHRLEAALNEDSMNADPGAGPSVELDVGLGAGSWCRSHLQGRRPSMWRRCRKASLARGLVKMSASCSVEGTYLMVMEPSATFSRT